MPTITFVRDDSELRGKRAAVVAQMLEQLVDADGDPMTWDELTGGVEHPHQYMPALIALELVGAVERYKYSMDGTGRERNAWALVESVEIVE